MITETTAISVIAMSLAGTTTFATVGWSYNLTWKRYWAKEAEESLDLARQALHQCDETAISRDTWQRLASDLQERIDTEAAKRSSITSRGNLTKAAKRKALVEATTAAVARDNAADRAEPRMMAA